MAKAGSILVTGANGGLGSSILSRVVSSGLGSRYHGVYTVRTPKSAEPVRASMEKCNRRQPQHAYDLVNLDLSSLASTRACARDINRRVADGSLPRIRALILNAGYQESTTLEFSSDGFAMTFQVNFLSHFLFTLMVLQSMDKERGRVMVVGSWSHDPNDSRNKVGPVSEAFKGMDTLFSTTEALARGTWSTPQEDPTLTSGFRRYGASKLCELLFMHELAARLAKDPELSNITVTGLDPGAMGTGLSRRGSWFMSTISSPLLRVGAILTTYFNPNGMFRTTDKSAADALHASFDVEGEKGKALYFNGNELCDTSAEARDEAKRRMLWTDSVGYAQIKSGDTVLAHWE